MPHQVDARRNHPRRLRQSLLYMMLASGAGHPQHR